MLIADLVAEFEVIYEIGSLGLPGFEEEEITRLLDIEQYKLINQRFQGNNVYQSKFPDTNKRIDDLLGLMLVENLDVSGVIDSNNEYLAQLPDEYLHIYDVRIKNTDGRYTACEIIPISLVSRFASGYRNSNPALRNPKVCLVANSSGTRIIKIFYFDPIDDTIDTAPANGACQIIYIKKPLNLTVDWGGAEDLSYFNDDVWHEIVRAAVDTAITIVTPQKAQVSQSQLNKTE